MAGRVRRGTEILDKPGKNYPADIELSIAELPRFVSRGGEKLDGFLDQLELPIAGATGLDVGASTGGFTDCLLQRGASSVTSVDVGRSQLHHRLVSDPRVTNLEGLNARRLTSDALPRSAYAIITVDVSFISLKLVLPSLWPLLEESGTLIALIKPQFEATKTEADKGKGVIRDPSIHLRITDTIRAFASENLPASQEIAFAQSTLPGSDGNIEFFLALRKRRKGSSS